MGEVLSVRRATGGSVQNGTSHFYGFDLAGNTRLLTDATGAVTDQYTFDAFGREVAVSGGTPNPFRYEGRFGYQRDAADLLHVGARKLKPSVGRWISTDPIGFEDSWNLYGYVFNNPVNSYDTSGLRTVGKPQRIPLNDNSIVCRGGKLVVQTGYLSDRAPDIRCTRAHERQHIKDWKDRYGDNLCKGVKDGNLPVGGAGYAEFLRKSECAAFKVGKKCRQDLLKSCKCTKKDKADIQAGINRDNFYLKKDKCK